MLRKFLHVPPDWSQAWGPPAQEINRIPAYAPQPEIVSQATNRAPAVESQTPPPGDAPPPNETTQASPADHASPLDLDWLVEQQSLGLEDCLGGKPVRDCGGAAAPNPPQTAAAKWKGEVQGEGCPANFRAVAAYKDLWLAPPVSALHRWQEAGLRPLSGALTAEFAVLCPRHIADDAWLLLRNVAGSYEAQGLGSLLPVAQRRGSMYAYDAEDSRSEDCEGGAVPPWAWHLRAAAVKLRRSLVSGSHCPRLAGNALAGHYTPLLVFLLLPEDATPQQTALGLRVAAEALGSRQPPPLERGMPLSKSCKGEAQGSIQLRGAGLNGELYGGAASMAYRHGREPPAAELPPAADEDRPTRRVTVQVVPEGAITNISGDIVQGLPFSIFPKLSRLALGEALKPPSSALHGTQAQPVLCVLQDHDRAEGEKSSARALHFCYTPTSGNSVALAWCNSTAGSSGCRLIHTGKADGGPPKATARPASPEPADTDAPSAKRRRVGESGEAHMTPHRQPQSEDLPHDGGEHVEAVLHACLEVWAAVATAGSRAARVVITGSRPMSDAESASWRRMLQSPLEGHCFLPEELCVVSAHVLPYNKDETSPVQRCVIDLEKPGCVRTWRGDPHAAGVDTAEVEAACLPPPLRQSSKEPQVLRLLRIEQVAVKIVSPSSVSEPVSAGDGGSSRGAPGSLEADGDSHNSCDEWLSKAAKELYSLTGLHQTLRHLQSGHMSADSVPLGMAGLSPYHFAVSMSAAAMYRALIESHRQYSRLFV